MPRGCVLAHDGQFEYTRYSCCCNTKSGVYYYTTYDTPTVRRIDMHSVDLDTAVLYSYPMVCDIMDECGLIDEDECDGDCQSCDLECDFEDENEDEEGEPWDGEEEFYQLSCPTCGEELVIDMEVLEKGEMKCPACGEELEFDTSALYEDEVKNPIEVK